MIVTEEINQFIKSAIQPSEGLLAEMEAYAKEHYVPISRPESAAFLRTICAMKRPERILEAGTAIGYSSIIMAEYLAENGVIDTVEIDEDTAELAKKNIVKAGYKDKIHVIVADAAEVFQCLEKKYDIVFLDAAKGQYKHMLADAKRVLKVGGILISDNVLFDGRVSEDGFIPHKHRTIVVNMREYIQMLMEDSAFETSLLSIGDGMTLSVKLTDEGEGTL